jgi:hypothetical protein
MRIEQTQWTAGRGWVAPPGSLGAAANLVLVFSSTRLLKDGALLKEVRGAWPKARIAGCSTSGEICGTRVEDETMVCTALQMGETRIEGSQVVVGAGVDSLEAGARLARALPKEELAHVFVLSDGKSINGSELVKGLSQNLPAGTTVTGGLAGDGERFGDTFVVWDGKAGKDTVAAVGFYGKALRVGCASMGGWDPFGPERLITKSRRNVLFEMDGRSALALYKQYLGDHASGLPATGLLFPLSLRFQEGGRGLVRTILAIDEKAQSLTFAGDVPEGAWARLMKANLDRLIDGASEAARASVVGGPGEHPPELAILISCVGRRMVLRQRVEEEVEGVRDAVGKAAVLTGFYSYGEIAPFAPAGRCELHNQTMTITTLAER